MVVIVKYLCYYCNGFPARRPRKDFRTMCFCKGTAVSGGGLGPPAQDLPGSHPCQVETYSGYRVHERPRRFTWQGEGLEVRRLLSRWQEPENLCFTVSANDSRRYLLKYHPQRDAWEVLRL
jgi:hypothetical protein